MKRYLIVFVSLFVCFTASAGSFEKGNELYSKGKYLQAISEYQGVVQSGKESSSLYYNIGNAYFKSDSLAQSIYYYEKALKLDPSDEDIHRNLDLARGRITDKIEPLPQLVFTSYWITYLTLFSTNTWSLLGIVACFISAFLFFLFLRAYLPGKRKLFFWSGTTLLFLAVCLIFTAQKSGDYFYGAVNAKAVVFGQSVHVNSTPSESGVVLFVIHEGTTVRIQDEDNGWYRVRLENGNSGWLKSVDVRIV